MIGEESNLLTTTSEENGSCYVYRKFIILMNSSYRLTVTCGDSTRFVIPSHAKYRCCIGQGDGPS